MLKLEADATGELEALIDPPDIETVPPLPPPPKERISALEVAYIGDATLLDGVPPIGYWLLARLLDAAYAGAYEETARWRNIELAPDDTEEGTAPEYETEAPEDTTEYVLRRETLVVEYKSDGRHSSISRVIRFNRENPLIKQINTISPNNTLDLTFIIFTGLTIYRPLFLNYILKNLTSLLFSPAFIHL